MSAIDTSNLQNRFNVLPGTGDITDHFMLTYSSFFTTSNNRSFRNSQFWRKCWCCCCCCCCLQMKKMDTRGNFHHAKKEYAENWAVFTVEPLGWRQSVSFLNDLYTEQWAVCCELWVMRKNSTYCSLFETLENAEVFFVWPSFFHGNNLSWMKEY